MKYFYALAIFLLAAGCRPPGRSKCGRPISDHLQPDSAGGHAGRFQASRRQALDQYIEAQGELQKFQKIYPDWNPKIVSFRLKYLAEKIAEVTAQLPPATNAPHANGTGGGRDKFPRSRHAPWSATRRIAGAGSEICSRTTRRFTAKLKEALAVQPAAVDSGELAKCAGANPVVDETN